MALALLPSCSSGGGRTAAASQAAPQPAADISRFATDKSSIIAGQTINLTAEFSNGSAIIEPGHLTPVSGVPLQLTPTQTTIYTLTITPGGVVTTLAGKDGEAGAIDGPGSAARFASPTGLALDAAGNLYVADEGNQLIRMVTPQGQVSTVAGIPENTGSDDGPVATASFVSPTGIAVDASGNLFVTSPFSLRMITKAGLVSTPAGGFDLGGLDGLGSVATFNNLDGLTLDGLGNLYVADMGNNAIRKIKPDATGKISPAAEVSTLAGYAEQPPGWADGAAGSAKFYQPEGLAVDGAGNTYVADSANNVIRKITPAGVVTTLAGFADQPGSQDGQGTAARFGYRIGNLACDGAGNLYLADFDNDCIRKITTSDGTVTTVVGAAGVEGTVPGPLPASLFHPLGVAWDPAGHLLISVPDAVVRVTF
jgi:sugar lactone lactonase YvrE